MWEQLHSGFGLLVLTGIAWGISEDRRSAKIGIAVAGITVQLVVAVVLLKLPLVTHLFSLLNG